VQEQKSTSDFTDWFATGEIPRITKEINEDITSPLFRLNLYRSAHSVYLAVSIHHVLYDGVAFPLLMREVDAIYNEADLDTPVPLSKVVYDIRSNEDTEKCRDFWASQFEGMNLGARRLREPDAARTDRRSKTLDVALSDIRDRCARLHTTLEALLACTFAHEGQGLFGWSGNAVFGVSGNHWSTIAGTKTISDNSFGQDESSCRVRESDMPAGFCCSAQTSSRARGQPGALAVMPKPHSHNHTLRAYPPRCYPALGRRFPDN
jgi:hypothetical protein